MCVLLVNVKWPPYHLRISSMIEITDKTKQQIVVKFLVKAGKTNAEIKTLVSSVFEEGTLSRSKLYEWIGHFREGWEAVLDDEREEHPRMACKPSVIAHIETEIDADCRRTFRGVVTVTSASHKSVRTVLWKDLNMSKVSPHFIPHGLTPSKNPNAFASQKTACLETRLTKFCRR